MSVFYKLYQEKRKGAVNKDKWYARSVSVGTIDTEGLITEIEKICTVTDADVLAVIRSLVFVMNQKLQESYRVKINGFGSFKIGLKTKPADTAKTFTVTKNVAGSRIVFQPETHRSNGTRTSQFLQGLQIRELPENAVVKEDDDSENPDTNEG